MSDVMLYVLISGILMLGSYFMFNSAKKQMKSRRKLYKRSSISNFVQNILFVVKGILTVAFLGMGIIFVSLGMDEYKKGNQPEVAGAATETPSAEKAGEKENVDPGKELFEKGYEAYNNGRTEEAVELFHKIKKKSAYYTKAQESLELIEQEQYWNSVDYPTYAEITKSPEDYVEKLVSFAGPIVDIVEHKGKTLVVIAATFENGFAESDVLAVYPSTIEYMENDMVTITGTMKGSYLQVEQKNFIGNYLNAAYSFSTTGYSNVNQIPVIEADHID